jgi:transcription elongation factor Elf1
MTPLINVKAFKCLKCGHVWLSKKFMEDGKTKPIACAKCKSAYWDREITTTKQQRKDKK